MAGGVLIIGAGQAGVQTAASLREGGFDGCITMLGEEPTIPYERPPLSKLYLKGELQTEQLYINPPDWYGEKNIQLQTSCTVKSVDVTKKEVVTVEGQIFSFDDLVFATGARNRQLASGDKSFKNVFDMRHLKHVDDLRPYIKPQSEMVIIGAGYLGLETAAIARAMGANVTIIELENRVLARVTSPVVSAFFEEKHNSNGVNIRTGVKVLSFNESNGTVDNIALSSGENLSSDVILSSIGVNPNSEIAMDAGVACDNGILVDGEARTNIPFVYAVGDCTKRMISPYGYLGRLESVHNAIEQGKQAAASILGEHIPIAECPWFWSDQYDIKLQIAGVSTGYDDYVIRGSIPDGKFTVFYFKDKVLIAADAINSPRDFMFAKRTILKKPEVELDKLANMDLSLREILGRWV